MPRTRIVAGAALAALLLGVRLAPAQPPAIANTALTTRTIAASLERELSAAIAATTEATWFAWSVPSTGGTGRGPCCWSGREGDDLHCGCQLEDGRVAGAATKEGTRRAAVRLEDSGRLVVLVRTENRAIQRFAAYSADCDLDAGGRPVVWLDGVKPADSVAYLAKSAADTPEGSGRPGRGVDILLLALSQHADPTTLPSLIQLAKSAPAAHVRGQALFWLAQQAGAKVSATIVGAIQDDPDTEVKKRAVFALSQLPKDEGVPLLINLARTNRNVEVRKQAMFWLGQSKDPRALAFFEEILTK